MLSNIDKLSRFDSTKENNTMKPNRATEAKVNHEVKINGETAAQKPETTTTPADLIARLRAASSDEEAVKIMQPDAKGKANVDAVYEVVVGTGEPLPQKRGVAVRIFVTAVRLNRPFKSADIEAAVEGKAVRYWVRRLTTTGHFREVAAS